MPPPYKFLNLMALVMPPPYSFLNGALCGEACEMLSDNS